MRREAKKRRREAERKERKIRKNGEIKQGNEEERRIKFRRREVKK
jgi:hypothetical protein